MSTVTEMLCIFCLRSVTTASPVCEENNTTQESIAISSCRHLMHMTCLADLIPADPVICRQPKCGKVLDRNQVIVIDAILKNRTVVESDEKCDVVDEMTTRLNVSMCNLVEEVTSRINTANDRIAQYEANAKHHAALEAEAEKRIREAEAAALDAKNLYKTALENFTAHLIGCTCTPLNASVPVVASNELPSTLKHPSSVPTSPIAQSSGVNGTLDQNHLRAEKMNNSNVANSPRKERHTIDSILAEFPNVLAGREKLVPFSESIEGLEEITDMSTKLRSLRHHHRDPRRQLSYKKTATTEKPVTERNINTKQSVHNTTNKSLVENQAGATKHSTSVNGYRRKLKDQKIDIAQEDHSPAVKRWKGPSEPSTHDYERYWQRFGMTPPQLKPFFPLNSFPFGYTAAGIRNIDKLCKVAIFAYDVLLLGDGHTSSIVNFIVKDKPFKDELFESLYRRDLGIVDLVATLNYFTVLPAKIILSIGNWDATQNMPSSRFLTHFKDLLQIFKKCQVKVLYTLPVITFPDLMDVNRHLIARCLNIDWGKTFGGEYVLLTEMVSNAIKNQLPVIDDKGLMYPLDQYEPFVEAIRDRFIPVAVTLPAEDKAEAEGPRSAPSEHQT